MLRSDKLVLLLALLAILLSAWVAYGIYEGLAQLEDEYAYQWQAQVLALGEFKIPSPPEAQEFLIPFVIDYEGWRFSKYPLGWPILLSFGERINLIRWVNPLLAGLAVWLTYRLGQKLLGNKVGLLAAGLTVISPLFLTYTGSILSHTWGLVLSLSLAVSWLDITDDDYDASMRSYRLEWLPVLVAGLSLGVLALSRPWTALGVAIPFGVHGLILLWRGTFNIRKRIIAVGVIVFLIACIHFLWQYALTGDPLQNPYLLWWPYDKIGFGEGFGVAEGGHSLRQGWIHTKNSLWMVWRDLFGWGRFTWLLLLPGLWAVRHQTRVWIIASVFPSLVLVYFPYWVSGPRYFYEGLYSLTILSAAGIAWLAGWLPDRRASAFTKRQGVVLAGLGVLVIVAIFLYTPGRLHEIKNRYGFSQADLEPFRTSQAQELAPALIIINTPDWWDYGVYLHLQDPYLTTPFIFAWAEPYEDLIQQLAEISQDRTIYLYNPEKPGEFYRLPRP
jgi:hypothetical protein